MSDEFLKKQSLIIAKCVENTLTKEEQELLKEFQTATDIKKEEMKQNSKIQQLLKKVAIRVWDSIPRKSAITQEQYEQIEKWPRK